MKHRRIRLGIVAGIILAVGVTPACSGEPPESASTGKRDIVAVRSFAFEPATLQIDAGTTVVWSNEDDIEHTVTSGTAGDGGVPGVSPETEAQPDGIFDEPLDGAGTTASFTFQTAGMYPYYCRIHDGMAAVIEVG